MQLKPSTLKPREKLETLGAHNLSNQELLAILINTGTRKQNALQIAQHLINQTADLQQLSTMCDSDFKRIPGIGKTKAAQLQAICELSRRIANTNAQHRKSITKPDHIQSLFIKEIGNAEQEIFAAAFLTSKHHLIKFEKLFYGSINHAHIYPREVVKRALKHNAAAMIVGHNHPSGDLYPSESDQAITKQLKRALLLIDTQLLDHIIVTHYEAISMTSFGML